MVTPIIAKSGGKSVFYFNIDGNVGTNSTNKPEDVQLVQFGYHAMSLAKDISPAEKAIYAKVVPGAAYSGGATDPLTVAIKTHQAARGGTQDGHVSVMTGNLMYADGSGAHTFMLTGLINHIRDLTKGNYPRLDKHTKCPALLATAVLRACGE